MKVKFCGIQAPRDVALAAALGCQAVGFVMVPGSRREVSLEQAQALTEHTRHFDLQSVILLADATADQTRQVITQCRPDILQFHGQESPAYCRQFNYPYWKAVPMLAVSDWRQYIASYEQAHGFVLDTYGGHQSGGSGQSFQWFRFPSDVRHQLILAGGLHANNVAEAVTVTGTEFIDVSSGIEATAGVKSHALMKQFMQAINTKNP